MQAWKLQMNQMSENNDPVVISYRKWLKVFILFGLPLFVAFSLTLLAGAILLFRWSILSGLVLGSLAIWFLYVTYLALVSLPYLNLKMTIQSDGIELISKKESRLILWQDIGRIRRDQTHQFLDVADKNGKRLFLIDFWISNFSELDRAIEEYCMKEEVL